MAFSPGSVYLGSGGGPPSRPNAPYIPVNRTPTPTRPWSGPPRPTGGPVAPTNNGGSNGPLGPGNYLPGSRTPLAAGQPIGTVGPTAVRATQGGPFDQAYRQNLATYAGGTLAGAKNGLLQFDPTNPNSLQGPGTDAGNAPVPGMPNTLLSQALGGQPTAMPFSTITGPSYLTDWLQGLGQGYNQPQQGGNQQQAGRYYGY